MNTAVRRAVTTLFTVDEAQIRKKPIKIIRPCNEDPLKPHFYIVKRVLLFVILVISILGDPGALHSVTYIHHVIVMNEVSRNGSHLGNRGCDE